MTHFGCHCVTLEVRKFAKSCSINCQNIICILLHYTILHLRALVLVKQQQQMPTKALEKRIMQHIKTNLCLLLVRVHILVKAVMEDLDTRLPQRHNICFLSLAVSLSFSLTLSLPLCGTELSYLWP